PDRHQPKQIVEPALRFAARSQIKQKRRQQRENPEGAKSYQPLSQRHAYILAERRGFWLNCSHKKAQNTHNYTSDFLCLLWPFPPLFCREPLHHEPFTRNC